MKRDNCTMVSKSGKITSLFCSIRDDYAICTPNLYLALFLGTFNSLFTCVRLQACNNAAFGGGGEDFVEIWYLLNL
jgi:hypothetical protein